MRIEQLLVIMLALIASEPALAQSLGMISSPSIWDSVESYCEKNGGTPQNGKCYFAGGGYCGLGAFYAGACPSRADREQAQWERGAYAFLYGDDDCYTCGLDRTPIVSSGSPPTINLDGAATSNTATAITTTASYWQNLADQQYALGSYQNASDLYTKALNLDPSLTIAWLNLGNCLFITGIYDRSLAAYEQALKLEPQNAYAWQGKGQDLQMLGRSDEAKAALEKAKALQPGLTQSSASGQGLSS
ncbi:MAG TPA: tetratricopeptide repeat protein [Methanotrichaceae archaeon]|nr:tetratricopeptide repeat protein [Methanotrichaceae archaeon]